jgi:hypothetical protein
MSTGAAVVEVVRGDLGDERADQVLDFWSRQGAYREEAAREQLPSVVSVAVDDDGEIVGVDQVEEATAPLVGRTFWIYRRLLTEYSDDLAFAMFNAAFEALAEEFEVGGGGPIGLCVVVEDRETMERRPEAIWPETELIFAGYLPDDRQVRIRYFWGATVGPGAQSSPNIDQMVAREYEMREQFRIEPLGEGGPVTDDDVIGLWTSEGVVAEDVARRRIDQVRLVAVAGDGQVAGISSVYLDRNPRLRMDLWHYRTFVASGYRHSSLAAQLLFRNLEELEKRFISGEDTRGPGILFHLENPEVMKGLNTAVWPLTGYTFIGDNPLGAHIRVRYFEGARVPPPQAH